MPTEDEHAARASSFGGVADVYERTRPDYPAEAVRWLLGEQPVAVVDVGAGTGKFTRVLVDAGHDVTAVEPSLPMLDLLRAGLPDVRAIQGGGESLPLGDGVADAVTYAQAWHWVDPVRASAEAARVLRPDGVLGLIWNLRRTDDPFGSGFAELIGGEDAAWSYQPLADDEPVVSPIFGALEKARFEHEQFLTRDELVGLVRSRSYVVLMPDDQRSALQVRVGELHDHHAADGLVTLRYVTGVYRSRPLPNSG